MNPDWRSFLIAHEALGAATGDAAVPPRDCTRYDLSHLGLIAVTGRDADALLQGQFTNDLRTLTAARAQFSAHCNPKGRMLDLFLVLRVGADIWLQLPRERVAPALQRLRMYVLRAQVTLNDRSDGPVRIGLAGPGAPRELERLGLPVPARDLDLAGADGALVLRLPGTVPRFELIDDGTPQTRRWAALSGVSAAGDADGWALLDIRAGIPSIGTATSDALVPQMANLQLLDGVSFTKGCYTGQEVVARMQYLGRLKRRLYVAVLESATPPRPGDALACADSTSEQGAGLVVDARPTTGNRYELLAVVEIAAAEGGEVRLGAGGPRLRFQAPPYGLPTPAG